MKGDDQTLRSKSPLPRRRVARWPAPQPGCAKVLDPPRSADHALDGPRHQVPGDDRPWGSPRLRGSGPLGYVTRARITQIMNLLHLAPDIQDNARRGFGLPMARRSLREVHAPGLDVIEWSDSVGFWRNAARSRQFPSQGHQESPRIESDR